MRVGLGQDSHRFADRKSPGKLILGGVVFPGEPLLEGNSDADVVLHSITNAISGVTCINILGDTADKMCLDQGIKDSSAFVRKAMESLNGRIAHLSVAIECKTPVISPFIPKMRARISEILDIPPECVGITATSGEGLTDFGRGLGIQVFSCVTVE